MKASSKFRETLQKMMETTPLDEINVTSVCEACGVHRQTFYYHYRNIYDLLDEIFLGEKVKDMDKAKSVKELILALVGYAKSNFAFLKAAYSSSAHDIVDSFILSKSMTRLLEVASTPEGGSLGKGAARLLARRMGSFIENEFSHVFRDTDITVARFERKMKRFAQLTQETIYPAMVRMAVEEGGR